MPALTCYRIRSHIGGVPTTDFDDVVDVGSTKVSVVGPVQGRRFTAQAYVVDNAPHTVPWAGFVESGFAGLRFRRSVSPAALLVVRARPSGRGGRRDLMFAFPFGVAGRYLLRGDAYERGYGLRTALNLLYPRSASEASRLRAVDSKRRGATIVRSRFQASDLSDFDAFDINRLRDVLNKATGVPADAVTWGRRIAGGDAVSINVDISFDQLGDLCRQLEVAHARDDYQDRFDWIDYIQPVADPALVERLEEEVARRVVAGDLDGLELAPPEIIDWERVTSFHYHFDRPQGPAKRPVTHADLRLADYRQGLLRTGRLADLDVAQLRRGAIRAVDDDGTGQYVWTAWKCLVGELDFHGESYVLDEGDFFRVRADYLQELDAVIDNIPTGTVALPASTPTTPEEQYNRNAAAGSSDLLLLDRDLVRITARTTPIEICDLLSRNRQLIHVKRHLGSADLSHLFAQGLVSAELLQMNAEFRDAARSKIATASHGSSHFSFLDDPAFVPSNYEVVYAIIERWQGRHPAEALPFFSKVNLREVATNLRSRGFKIALNQIQA